MVWGFTVSYHVLLRSQHRLNMVDKSSLDPRPHQREPPRPASKFPALKI
jgi:hypothetical protein